MTTLYEAAYAKLNLTLDVLGKREDGYHDLQSVMQTISIRDDIEIDVGTGKPWRLLCSDETLPTDERNLAWKAADVFCRTMNRDPDGLEIRIVKRIPSGAGMGGGSADAAAVLRALNRHYGEPLSVLALAELGAQVGSDVPFCVLGGTAMVEGSASQEVNWSVVEKNGGSIDRNGLYTAPSTEGVFEIRAQSAKYGNYKASAYVVVSKL